MNKATEKEFYSCLVDEIKKETVKLKEKGINPIWEIPSV